MCAAHDAGRARHAARAAIHGCWGNQGTASGCCYEGGAPRQQALTTSWLGAAFTMAALYSAFVHADTRLGGAPAASFHQLFSASRAARACACSSSFLQGGAVWSMLAVSSAGGKTGLGRGEKMGGRRGNL